ncbi:MAG: aromatic ring-hydroxylating dioxygenase subunit alpha [Rhodobacteraceae bacterium]|nr:aromatic ring-hydroxylating dioxygenase subunit alpha [Paracoccaceae bacterium]
MNREMQIQSLEALYGLNQQGSAFLDETVTRSPIGRYTSQTRFEAERAAVFRGQPILAAHGSELPENGSFLTLQKSGLPILLTRDSSGRVNAFLNVCRHRGAKLVHDEKGCKGAFSCPYHAWTFANTGELRGVPHQKQGFPEIDKAANGLKRLPAVERLGFIWIVATPDIDYDFDTFLAPLEQEMAWIDMDQHVLVHVETVECRANWKLLLEAGLEAYHFRVAHKETVGPHMMDNLSSYHMFGPHIRSVLPRTSLPDLDMTAPETWDFRELANVVYTVFPTTQFLTMQDHFAWINVDPVAPDHTRIRLGTLAPAADITPEKAAHWTRNHAISKATLSEDFDICVDIQAGLDSGANDALTYGRYEGALDRFNAEIEAVL